MAADRLNYIGVLQEEDLATIPEPMADAYRLLRRLAYCGMPFARRNETLRVYCSIRNEYTVGDWDGYRAIVATIALDGSIKFDATIG